MVQQPGQHKLFSDAFLVRVKLGPETLVTALFFGVLLLGVWMGNQHSAPKPVHSLGAVIAVVGAILFFLCAWLTYRAWKLQKHR